MRELHVLREAFWKISHAGRIIVEAFVKIEKQGDIISVCYIRQRQEEFRQIFMLSHTVFVCTTWNSRVSRSVVTVRNRSYRTSEKHSWMITHVSIDTRIDLQVGNRKSSPGKSVIFRLELFSFSPLRVALIIIRSKNFRWWRKVTEAYRGRYI